MLITGFLVVIIFSILLAMAIKVSLPTRVKAGFLLFVIISIVSAILIKEIILLREEKMLEGKKFEGKILYVVSNKINEIDIISKKKKEIYQGSNTRLFSNLNKVDDNRLLFEISGSIEFFDLNSKVFSIVCEGEKPAYISEINSVFYYKYKKGLYQKKLDSDKEEFITENIYTYSISEIANSLYYPHSPDFDTFK